VLDSEAVGMVIGGKAPGRVTDAGRRPEETDRHATLARRHRHDRRICYSHSGRETGAETWMLRP
jgi:hypothetical protein